MYYLQVEGCFDSAHFLKNYEGKCSNIHGHRWRIVVDAQSEHLITQGQEEGMVMDFGDLKKALKEIVDALDHALIVQKDTLRSLTLNCLVEDGFNIVQLDFRPTAENFAHYFYDILMGKGFNIKRVYVYETPTNCAIYEATEACHVL
jgi:6-pyruvoyltetrahydropterin/6-carboxytetrahydropterin synthase